MKLDHLVLKVLHLLNLCDKLSSYFSFFHSKLLCFSFGILLFQSMEKKLNLGDERASELLIVNLMLEKHEACQVLGKVET